MGIQEQKLWKHLEVTAAEDHAYMTAVKDICNFAVNRASMINITFPMYTLHNETHICNVLRLMADLLGDRLDELTQDETAMLILAACCHDIGMSVSEAEQQELLEDDRLARYLDARPWAYNIAYAKGGETPELTPELLRDYLRSIHHERAADLLCSQVWPMVLVGKVGRDDLIRVCQSHGEDIHALNGLDTSNGVDLRLCAVLLRLADILDFDTSRAPKAVYDYLGFDGKDDPESEKSREEWRKHMGSAGFDFTKVENRSYPYDLPYAAKCNSMQQEQGIRRYLGWVDEELTRCAKALKRYAGKWNDLVLPDSVEANITAENYVSGPYRLTLDQSQVLNLLVGENLYSDPGVFVRELIQNAIDAVRTREKLDRNLPRGWKPQINIRTWMDEEGYHWFRIEDNGTGMDEHIILKHLLTVGSSYYNSDAFRKEKLRCGAEDYTPISRFGIGILSCFMGDTEHNRVEISTKRFRTGDAYPPALRLTMQGLSGYYYMANKDLHHRPGPMVGQNDEERKPFLSKPGTVVAVRTNLYQSGGCRGFKEIVDKYVVYPPVPIHYVGPEGTEDYLTEDYLTEDEFMKEVHAVCDLQEKQPGDVFTYRMNEEQLAEIHRDCPELVIEEVPGIQFKCLDFDNYTRSPNLKGAMVAQKTIGKISIDNKSVRLFSTKLGQLSVEINAPSGNETSLSINDYVVCNFGDLSWYEKLFRTIVERSGRSSSIAHNGVFCEGIDGFHYNRNHGDGAVADVVLLRDKYRPELDWERNGIRQLPLEALVDLALMREQIEQEGYRIGTRLSGLDMSSIAHLPAEAYLELMGQRDDFLDRMMIPTEDKRMKPHEYLQAIQHLGMSETPLRIQCDLHGRRHGSVLENLLLAWLGRECVLRIDLEENACDILATPEQPSPDDIRWLDFPPGFFLPPKQERCPWLATSKRKYRLACNANHNLSRFLIDNVKTLKDRTPGVFRDILDSLVEDNADKLIPRVNGLLDFLRHMPGSHFSVPADLRLKEDDFC